jgi:hypothetical protein
MIMKLIAELFDDAYTAFVFIGGGLFWGLCFIGFLAEKGCI